MVAVLAATLAVVVVVASAAESTIVILLSNCHMGIVTNSTIIINHKIRQYAGTISKILTKVDKNR